MCLTAKACRGVVRRLNPSLAGLSTRPEDVIQSGREGRRGIRFKTLHVGQFEGIAPANRMIEVGPIHIWSSSETASSPITGRAWTSWADGGRRASTWPDT